MPVSSATNADIRQTTDFTDIVITVLRTWSIVGDLLTNTILVCLAETILDLK